ncbi:BH3-interacting domain death agonist [Sceloporus undulatus]|uniref:BH3-interacting domain death agonist n=1 Tax=Sceloporus undulatus TaxID=8520 RepID=UPI001C4D1C78|nr:BH3-interacting domain death agonist [Sceloporus undulatus]
MNQVDSNYYGSQGTPTAILLYSFLQNSTDTNFFPELCALKNQLLPSRTLSDDEELQTDGNRFGRPPSREPVSDEEIFQIIGAQLAEIGDKLAAEMEPSIIHSLARQFMAENMTKEEMTRHMSQAVEELLKRMPLDMEQEKAMLVIAMTIAKKVADKVPALLQQVFNITMNYINHNLRDYVNNLAPES